MWGAFTGWWPGLAKTLEAAQPGIVETPADMQAESDAADAPGAPDAVPAAPCVPPFGPEPGAPARPEGGSFIGETRRGGEPRHAPPCDAQDCEICVTPGPAGQDDAAPMAPVDVTATLQATNQRLRRELATAQADAIRYARQLAAEKRAHAQTREQLAAARAQSPVTAVGAFARLAADTATPPSPVHDRSTTRGGQARRPGVDAGTFDGSDAALRLGAADLLHGGEPGIQGGGVGDGPVRER